MPVTKQWWLETDPLIPGISYVVIFSFGALLASLSPRLAMGALICYLLIAVGANIGETINTQSEVTNNE